MRWKLIGSAGTPAYVVVLDPGDEAAAVLSGFAVDRNLTGAQVTAVGARCSAFRTALPEAGTCWRAGYGRPWR